MQSPGMLDTATTARVVEVFKALSSPTRTRIVALLIDGEMRVGELSAALGMGQSAVSHQLRILRNLHLVRWRRDGKEVFYTLDDDHVADLYLRAVAHVAHRPVNGNQDGRS